MKVKSRILSFVLAAVVAVAAFPIAAYAESEPSGEARSRAAMRHIRGEIEARESYAAEQEARAAVAENEETADTDPAVIIVSSDHRYITPETKSIGVTVRLNYAIPDQNDIYLTLIDPSGKEIGRSSSVYNKSLNPLSAIYVIDLTEDMSAAEPGGEYIIKANSVNNIEFIEGSREIRLTLNDVPIIVSSGRSGQNTYDFIMENIEPGTYETYDSSYNPQVNGTLNVESGGAAVWTMNDPYSYYSDDLYLQTGTEEDGSPVMTELSFDSVYEYADVPSVSQDESDLVIRSGASSVKNCHYVIYSKTMPKSNDISSIKLLSGGNVMAEGENIRLAYANYYEYMDCWRAEVLVDFPSIDMSKAAYGSAVLQIITTFGELTADCMIVPENEYAPMVRSYINVSSIYYNGIDYVSRDNIPFDIYDTNFTEGEIQLYELGEMTDNGQEVKFIASKPLSELKRTDGLLYIYTGSFTEDLDPGKQYYISYFNKNLMDAGEMPDAGMGSPEFTVADKPMINSYYNYIDNYNCVASDNQYIYAMAININYDTDKIAACYYDESGNKVDIPLTAEKSESYNEFGEVYEAPYEACFTFDFSKIPAFDEMDVHILVNDEEIAVLPFRDFRGECVVQYAGIGGNLDKESLYMEGYNLDKGDITLRIYGTGEYNYETTIGEKVRETAVKADNNEYSDYCYFPLDSLYLPEGKYYYEVYQNGEPIISGYEGYMDGFFTIGAAEVDPDIPTAVTDSVVEGSEMKVDLLNMSGGEIKANVIVGAYDENGALTDLSGEVPVTIAPNGELKGVSVPTAADAARYKVFVWDSLKDMRPYSKAN